MADKATDRTTDEPKVESPKETAQKGAKNVQATNSNIDKAGEEATSRLKGSRKEAANTVDSILGADDQHGIDVKTSQAASFGEEYDPKTDPEENPAPVTPAPSQNQNNLKHPDSEEDNDPQTSRNYLGQKI